jgi:hypothetical protein
VGRTISQSGPGGVHLLNGLYGAKLDGQPCWRPPAWLTVLGDRVRELV